uniref:Uncharacterized protein n=1 Tax=Lepeophtheirus salmonis TaxID=72036 RepID=A0A0K2VJT6_LEPSM
MVAIFFHWINLILLEEDYSGCQLRLLNQFVVLFTGYARIIFFHSCNVFRFLFLLDFSGHGNICRGLVPEIIGDFSIHCLRHYYH